MGTTNTAHWTSHQRAQYAGCMAKEAHLSSIYGIPGARLVIDAMLNCADLSAKRANGRNADFGTWMAWALDWAERGVSAQALHNAAFGKEAYDGTQAEVQMRMELKSVCDHEHWKESER